MPAALPVPPEKLGGFLVGVMRGVPNEENRRRNRHAPGMPSFDRLEFHVEQWDAADLRVERLIAASDHLLIAKAAFRVAVQLMPGGAPLLAASRADH